jgi:hypothetical protein
MPKKYTSEQFWKLYKELPEELKNALSGDETSDNVYSICEKYGILDDLEEVVESISQVLLGLLSPTDLQEVLEKEIKLEKIDIKRMVQEINRFIFHPVKKELEELYKMEFAPLAQMKITPPPQERAPEMPREDDTYREPVE